MIVAFEYTAFEDFQSWAREDKKIFKKIGELIKDASRTPFQGIGKPEPLKNELSGYWSRRITDEHRLIYKYENETLTIISCKYHYRK
ncbi:Txe/YoeB family addiction module toxin [Marispirochaeta sp.]|uniref:Txe/YoeB family addiction module toxin n=1 Tax=Marispirochaeta sp. TaxID=2038653 RepID=UPI0029C96928|nr:Txe/YoeB family addiction module toxin [Marispirochaeta sp.]